MGLQLEDYGWGVKVVHFATNKLLKNVKLCKTL